MYIADTTLGKNKIKIEGILQTKMNITWIQNKRVGTKTTLIGNSKNKSIYN